MNLKNLFKIAFSALYNNKFRCFLTMLGIIIGVAAVISMLAIGEGSKRNIEAQIAQMGSNMIMIYPESQTMGGVRQSGADLRSLELEDFEDIAALDCIKYATPIVSASGQFIYKTNNTPSTIYGVNENYLDIKMYEIKEGRNINDNDIKRSSKVCIIGQSISNELFTDGENPIGKTIRYKNIPLKIIGILESKGYNSMGQDQDDIVLAPYTCVQKRMLAVTHFRSIFTSASEENKSEEAIVLIEEVLRKNHKIKEGEEDDFRIRSQEELASMLSSTSNLMGILLSCIASISLLVGGIGIMNIMYVSVTERIKEIGLRIAIGAKSRDILLQFLVEAFIISISGGIIGVILGVCATYTINFISSWWVHIEISSILLSFGVCCFIGIFFGWYPAKKAAKLNPIDAIRHE